MNSPRVTGQELSPSRACGPHTCQITEGNSSRSPWEREEPVPGSKMWLRKREQPPALPLQKPHPQNQEKLKFPQNIQVC